MAWYTKESVIKFQSPSTITLVASSNSGKTTFVKRMLQESDGLFTVPIEKVLYCYGSKWQTIFNEMLQVVPNISFKDGIPSEDDLKELAEGRGSSHACLILDDLSSQLYSNKDMEKLWTAHSHHMHITVICLVHNLFPKSPSGRIISLNTKYFILFRNYRDALQIQHFARQIYPTKVSFFMSSYHKAVEHQWGYIVVDLHGSSNEKYRLRTNIFPNEDMVIFQQKD